MIEAHEQSSAYRPNHSLSFIMLALGVCYNWSCSQCRPDVTDISITYPDSTNQSLYQMFSSNYPIPGFNKPEMLYVTDGVVGVEMNINIVIENLGTVQSGFVDVEILVLHNEYTRFELLNTSKGVSPISGSSSASLDVLWTPTTLETIRYRYL